MAYMDHLPILQSAWFRLCDLSEEHEGIDNLTAQIDEGSHKRIFKIVRGNGGKSYASDIAQAFGLTKDEIVKNAKAARTAENAWNSVYISMRMTIEFI